MAALYLDYCASTPIDKRVLEAMNDVYVNHYGNAGSRTHIYGLNAKGIVEESRRVLAEILNVEPSEVIFTSGASESDNIATLGFRDYAESSDRKHIITTAIEHKAILEPLRYLESKGFQVDYVRPGSDGRINAADIIRRVRDDTLLVSVMHVNNETGVMQPVCEIGEALASTNTWFHIDAAQSFGKLDDELRGARYDLLSLSGHKIHGPQGIGALIVKRSNYKRPPIHPIMFGGKQEYGFRPGTVPVALVAGLAKAAELMDKEYPTIRPQLEEIKSHIVSQLSRCDYSINGIPEYTLPNILNLSIKGVDAESVFTALKNDFAFSNGSACTSGTYAPSYVLQAMGLGEERIEEALRISWWDEPVDLSALVAYAQSIAR